MLRAVTDDDSAARDLLGEEARALLTRLHRIKPFALQEPMLPAAALSPAAQVAIERHLVHGRRDLRAHIEDFLAWLEGSVARRAAPRDLQRRFVQLRLRFNVVLSQFDLFSDAIAQRSEHETGVWLAGLDVVASDALRLPGSYFESPPIVCYLDRGPGGAIRRARTRLPGGGSNPVALIRVPRERMIGSGIASSLAHEVGHQGATLLELLASLRPALAGMQTTEANAPIWALWECWIGEVVADLWAVARVGVASTLGLIGVVSLPRSFVFHVDPGDPHPVPWIRVKLSCTIGQALYPHPQWERLARLWDSFYPLDASTSRLVPLLDDLQASLPALVDLLLEHRPPLLAGRTLGEALSGPERHPDALARLHREWRTDSSALRRTPPSLAFAVVGQARADGEMTPEEESQLLADLLTAWALEGAMARGREHSHRTRSPGFSDQLHSQGEMS